jgi:predicted branched-subunit amino acid permease
MKQRSAFFKGFWSTIPIITGVIPFGAVVGTVCAEINLSFVQVLSMDFLVYAGAAQLAAVDLMSRHAAGLVVVLTGLVINLRFLLYSAALSPSLKDSSFFTKLFCSWTLTDQSYAVMSAHKDKLHSHNETVQFYIGTAVCMLIAWHLSVAAGFIFGNFAPASWALEYAVPLSFVALVIPTLKNRTYVFVAVFSSLISILLYQMPYRTGLIATAGLALVLAALLTRKKKAL